jgi:hypothetical protein
MHLARRFGRAWNQRLDVAELGRYHGV